MDAEITVRNDPESGRYVAVLGDRDVGRIIYERRGGRAIFRHTIIEPEFQGEGVGTALVRGALDDLGANGLSLTNYCSFVTEFMADNPSYAGLLDPARPGRHQADGVG
jgi:uncharacterized protein